MSSDIPPSGAVTDQELTHLLISSLERGYGSDGGEPFYTHTLLSGQPQEDNTPSTLVAYCAARSTNAPGQKPLSYVVVPRQKRQAYSQDQLMEALLGHDTPYMPKSQYARSLNLQALQPVFETACLLAAQWHLPALAVIHVVSKAGEDRVEFVAPRQVRSISLINYLQIGSAAGQQ